MEQTVFLDDYKTELEPSGLTSLRCLHCNSKAPVGQDIQHITDCKEYGTPRVPIKYD